MKSQKVCITTLEFPPDVGGVGESVHRIAKMLSESGYEVHVAVFHSKQRKEDGYRRSHAQTDYQDGIYVHRLESANRSDQPIMQDYLSEIYFLLKQLHHQHQFDLFHAFFINETGFLTTMLAQEENIPIINSIRGSDLHKHIFNPKQHGQVAWTLEHSSWVTFVSRDLQKRGCVLVPSLRTKSTAFWNSIQPLDVTKLPTPALVGKLQGTVVGSVGRFRDKKGLEYLLDACTEANREQDLTLLLVGDFADRERAYWEHEVQSSGIADRVIITGMLERTQALAYLPYMDIFTVPSLHDGCPNALLEAMMAGCAVIGTNVDAIGEILEDGRDSLVVQPASGSELAEAIQWLARSPQLRQQLGTAARAKVLKDLAPAVEQENWNRVYERVLGTAKVAELVMA
ncbi:MAG: glycosyltransferase [Oculatellaceae cyanobacterium Prado106]|jgi:glycosyltransferase involved in cell wall biosynthesis|nr:glycosyltransferase [Oculatellaceae cyanobacterium Prado106]